jgi:hypothetical protein
MKRKQVLGDQGMDMRILLKCTYRLILGGNDSGHGSTMVMMRNLRVS